MADTASLLDRAHTLAGRRAGLGGVGITPAAPAFRMSLRCAPDAITSLSKALGVELPVQPKTSAAKASRTALWLGPDEWLIVDDKADPNTDLAGPKAVFSAVDISHRNTAIIIDGANAAELVAHDCPQDVSLAAFAKGACSRTVFGKAEIVLFRPKQDQFRIEVWRSFADYVFTNLVTAAKDLG